MMSSSFRIVEQLGVEPRVRENARSIDKNLELVGVSV
jgi:hypothetical protein